MAPVLRAMLAVLVCVGGCRPDAPPLPPIEAPTPASPVAAGRVVVGILRTDAAIMGTPWSTPRNRGPEWEIVRRLREHYDVHDLNPALQIPADVDVLLVPQLPSLTQPELDRVGAYLDAGRPALLTVDPLPVFNVFLAPGEAPLSITALGLHDEPERPPKGDAQALLQRVGVHWVPSHVLFDFDNPHLELASTPPQMIFVSVASQATEPLAKRDPALEGVDEVVVMYGGELSRAASFEGEFVPLLATGPHAGRQDYEAMVSQHPLFGPSMTVGEVPRSAVTGDRHVIAARVEGGSARARVIVIADLDLFGDQFAALGRPGPDLDGDGIVDLVFDNVAFLLNSVADLAAARREAGPDCDRVADPSDAAFVDIIEDEEFGAARHLSLVRRQETWTTAGTDESPAHLERVAALTRSFLGTSAAEIGDDPTQHAAWGLLDPEGVGEAHAKGRRVTIGDHNGSCLVDLIVGRQVEGRPGFRYARRPREARVLALPMKTLPSAAQEDWLDRFIRGFAPGDLIRLSYEPHVVDDSDGTVREHESIVVVSGGSRTRWELDPESTAPPGRALDSKRIGRLVDAMARVEFVGQRPRSAPRSLVDAQLLLQPYGFYLGTRGELLGSLGMLQAVTADGVVYTLFFGGRTEAAESPTGDPVPGRFVLAHATYDADLDTTDAEKGSARAAKLDAELSRYFYVVSDAQFAALHPAVAELLGPP